MFFWGKKICLKFDPRKTLELQQSKCMPSGETSVQQVTIHFCSFSSANSTSFAKRALAPTSATNVRKFFSSAPLAVTPSQKGLQLPIYATNWQQGTWFAITQCYGLTKWNSSCYFNVLQLFSRKTVHCTWNFWMTGTDHFYRHYFQWEKIFGLNMSVYVDVCVSLMCWLQGAI